MPTYIKLSRVDWGWPQRSEAERATIRRYQPLLDESDHGDESFTTLLRKACGELPGVEARAVVEYDHRGRALFVARDGVVEPVQLVDTLPGASGRRLPSFDDRRTIRCGEDAGRVRAALAKLALDEPWDDEPEGQVELVAAYRTEEDLRAAMSVAAGAMTEGRVELIVQVEGSRYLVTLQPGEAELRRLVTVAAGNEEHTAVARALLAAAPEQLFPVELSMREHVAAFDGRSCEQALYFPERMLAEISSEAIRTDRSLSSLVQQAWTLARERMQKLPNPRSEDALLRPYAEDGKCKQTLHFPGVMLVEMSDEAQRADSSLSRVAQLAYMMARRQIITQPTVSGIGGQVAGSTDEDED